METDIARLSHITGAGEPPLLEMTIGQALEQAVKRWPDEPALVSRHQNRRLNWAELKEAAEEFALGLISLGLRAGDRVAVWAPNCVEWTIAQLATGCVGIIQVNINPAYRVSELEYTLNKVGAKTLICAASFKTSDYVAMVENLFPGLGNEAAETASLRLPLLQHFIKIGGPAREGWLDFDGLVRLGKDQPRHLLASIASGLKPHDPINIQFTSGTTGQPKGATLSHHNILNNAYFCGREMGLRAGDKLCVPVPLYHCFGMVMGNLTCMVNGVTIVYPSAGFEPLAVLETIEAERCTAVHGVPTMFIAELEHPEFSRFDLSSLRTGLMAGAPCPTEVMNKVMTLMHMSDVGVAYGMTETSPVSFQTALSDTVERRVSTIGRVQPHLEVKIIDPATGEIVPRGMPGELCTRGYSIMLGYWEDPERTADAIRDGWMHTGDLAIIDDEGYGLVVGRAKDMIIRGGENIYPREIEEYLFRHDAVEDVQVVGVPDERFGEEVCACVRVRAGKKISEADVIAFCRDQIAHYKVPRYVCFMEDFPMTVTGKVQKNVLRDMVSAQLKNDL